jgi:hypothetical protein
VISVDVPTPILFAFTSWRLRYLQISTTPATPPNEGRSGMAFVFDVSILRFVDGADHLLTE